MPRRSLRSLRKTGKKRNQPQNSWAKNKLWKGASKLLPNENLRRNEPLRCQEKTGINPAKEMSKNAAENVAE